MDAFDSLFARSGFLPHGYCFTWSPGLLWSMVLADALTAAAYFSIPLAIIHFVRQRGPQVHHWVPWLFSAFIFACGLTHVMDIWTIWQPDYALQALAKLATAAISVATAVALWPLIPKALRIPSVGELQRAITSMEAEILRRRTVEQHLGEMEQTLAVTLDSIGAGFIATDAHGRVTRMNPVAERLTGWTQSQARGARLWHVFRREGRPPELEQRNPIDVMQAEGITADVMHAVVISGLDGTRSGVEVHAALRHDDQGRIAGMTLVVRDVTRLNTAETELRRLAAIVASSGDAIVSKTLDGRITSWNRAAEQMFGYPAAEAVGMPVQRLIPPDRVDEEMRILASLADGREVPTFDTVRLTRDGRRMEVSVTISPVFDATGRVVGGAKIARDVTAQRRTEAALRDSRARLHFALDRARIGDWSLDLATDRLERSPGFDRCFGLAAGAGPRNRAQWMATVHEGDRESVDAALAAALAAGSEWQAECRVVHPDGTLHWLSLHGVVPADAAGATRMLGIVSDITLARQAAESRLKAHALEIENQQIQAANRLKSQFLANMSHELRTPLNAVIGFAELLHGGAVPPDSPRHREFLGHIATSGHHLLQLINDVLDLSKVEAGRMDFAPEPVRLDRLIDEVCNVLQAGVDARALHLHRDVDPRLGEVELDPARLKQALYNYLSNAIKFSAPGGHIGVRALAEGPDHLRIEVQDEGIGIAEDDLPRLFVEFQQLDAGLDKQHQGTGLGLALTRRLVEAQGGAVGVTSAPGRGSVFHLVLPRRAGAPARPPAPLHRLLMVEPDLPLVRSFEQGLAPQGVFVDMARDPAQAMRLAAGRPYDAIALGLGAQPRPPALQALAAIRDTAASRHAPVHAFTLPGAGPGAAAFAVADVLRKPPSTDEIRIALMRLPRDPSRRLRLMVVDDDPRARALMAAMLEELQIDAWPQPDGAAALRALDTAATPPDAVILDLVMPGLDGFAVLHALRQRPGGEALPVFIWTSLHLTDDEYAMLAASAQAVARKGSSDVAQVLAVLRRHWQGDAQTAPQPD